MNSTIDHTRRFVKNSFKLYFEPLVLLIKWMFKSIDQATYYIIERATGHRVDELFYENRELYNTQMVREKDEYINFGNEGENIYQYQATFKINGDVQVPDLETSMHEYLHKLEENGVTVIDSNEGSIRRERKVYKSQNNYVTLIFHASNAKKSIIDKVSFFTNNVMIDSVEEMHKVDRKELENLRLGMLLKRWKI